MKCVTYNLVIKLSSNYEMLVLESIANCFFFYFQNQMQLDSSLPNKMRNAFCSHLLYIYHDTKVYTYTFAGRIFVKSHVYGGKVLNQSAIDA